MITQRTRTVIKKDTKPHQKSVVRNKGTHDSTLQNFIRNYWSCSNLKIFSFDTI